MVHLLRTRPVVHALVRRCHGAHVFEGLNSPVLVQPLRYGLVLGELVHDHLLMGLLGCEHI